MYQQIDSNKRNTAILMVIFIAFVLFLGWLFGYFTETGYGGLAIAAIIALVMTLTSYFSGDKIALVSSGAKKIEKQDNPYVYRMVENLCITAGIPEPKVHIINDDNINAFATGRNPKNASIAITTGAIEKLENEELEAVIAHELSHIKNYDIRLMMVIVVLIGTIALISDWLLRGVFGNRKGKLGGIIFIAGLLLAILSPLIAELIKLAISRKREYLADASGGLLTRYPEALANALEKIKTQNIKPMKKATHATAHLYIANPFGSTKSFLNQLFSTHPPIDDRIAKLKKMA